MSGSAKDVASFVLTDKQPESLVEWKIVISYPADTKPPDMTLTTAIASAKNVINTLPKTILGSMPPGSAVTWAMTDMTPSLKEDKASVKGRRRKKKNSTNTLKHKCSICREEENQKPDGLIL